MRDQRGSLDERAPLVFYSSSTSLQSLHLRNPISIRKTITVVDSGSSGRHGREKIRRVPVNQ
jgi:hypothetical protein